MHRYESQRVVATSEERLPSRCSTHSQQIMSLKPYGHCVKEKVFDLYNDQGRYRKHRLSLVLQLHMLTSHRISALFVKLDVLVTAIQSELTDAEILRCRIQSLNENPTQPFSLLRGRHTHFFDVSHHCEVVDTIESHQLVDVFQAMR